MALLLARDIERQVKEDECICVWCDAAFKTLKRSVDNPATIDDEGHRILVRADKIRRKYWADLDKRNLKCAERAKKALLEGKEEELKC